MKLRHLVYVYIGTIPAALLCDALKLPTWHPLGNIIELTNFILLPIIIIWSIIELIKYFIRYFVKYQNSYRKITEIEEELDEIEASLDNVAKARDAKENVTLIWDEPPKKP